MPGEKNDLEIFRSSLMTWLEPFERVEADDGYEGEAPLKVKCPSSIGIPEEKHRMMGIVRRRQETVNTANEVLARLLVTNYLLLTNRM